MVKIALVALIVLCIGGYFLGTMGLKDIQNLAIEEVNLSSIPDGTFKGSFHKSRWNHDVEVTVNDNVITAIKNTNKLSSKHQKEIVDTAINRIITKQSLRIDVVSGASVNTKAFQKAVESALLKGAKK